MDYRHWTPEEVARLGQDTDANIAEELDRTEESVRRKRNKLGIAASREWKREWTKAELKLLGKLTDKDVAEQLGCDRKTVITKRRELGIPNPVTGEI